MKKPLSKQLELLKAGQFFYTERNVFFADTEGGVWIGQPGYVPQPWGNDTDPQVDNLNTAPTAFQLEVMNWLDWITPIVAEKVEDTASKP